MTENQQTPTPNHKSKTGTAREPTDSDPSVSPDKPLLKDISHVPPEGDGANRVWDGTRVYERDADDE